MDAAEQPSEKWPDYLPGVYGQRLHPQRRVRAFRLANDGGFPLDFLAVGERIQKVPGEDAWTLLITEEATEGTILREGQWAVRHRNGVLGVFDNDNFREQFTFAHGLGDGEDWTGDITLATETVPAEHPIRGTIDVAANPTLIGSEDDPALADDEPTPGAPHCDPEKVADEEMRREGRLLAGAAAVERAVDEPPPPGLYYSERQLWARTTDPVMRQVLARLSRMRGGRLALAAPPDAERLTCDLANGAGWKGKLPAEGTRRRLILDAIESQDVLSTTEALEFADAIECALLQAAIDDENESRSAAPSSADLADAAATEILNRLAGLEERTLLSLLGMD